MDLLLIISAIWLAFEIILSRMQKKKDSANDLDRSSLKILRITITVSITTGIFLRKTDFLLSDFYSWEIYYTGILLICIGLLIRWIAILTLKKSFTVNVTVSSDQTIVQAGI